MYRKTLFDRLGPDAGSVVRAIGYGVAVFGLCLPMFAAASQKLEHQMSFGWNALWVFFWSLMCGAGASLGSLWLGNATGGVWKRFAVDGTSTPYREQYSYQQSLVMRGRLHEALESFEAVMAEKPDAVDVVSGPPSSTPASSETMPARPSCSAKCSGARRQRPARISMPAIGWWTS